MRRILIVGSIAMLAAACSDTPAALEADLLEPQLGKVALGDGPVAFTGRATFAAYFSVSGEWFLNPDYIWCPATAELSFTGGHGVVLTTTELGPCGGRQIAWEGTLTPGGALKLNMPAHLADEVMEHTGCTPSGTFPVYHGHYDGVSLNMAGDFHGHCDGGTVWGPFFGFPDDPGPVHVSFGFEFTRD